MIDLGVNVEELSASELARYQAAMWSMPQELGGLARPEQRAPEGDWRKWLYLGGRGTGKTRSAAEDVKSFGLDRPQSRIAVVAPTYADARDVCVEGESGLLNVLPFDSIKTWNRSIGELILTNRSRYHIYTADKPRKARGPQHHRVWGDEVAEWRYPETWDLLMLGLRLGDNPQAIATGTPKPVRLIRELIKDPDCVVTRGSTYDNKENLPANIFREIVQRYEGTSLGRQEIYAELLDEVEGALWKRSMIQHLNFNQQPEIQSMQRVVIGLDPSASDLASPEGSEAGIVVAGKIGDLAFIIEDGSGYMTPNEWAKKAIDLYHGWQADAIIAETNQGGAMVKHLIHAKDPRVRVKTVHAKRGKYLRAEPVIGLYETSRVMHFGSLAQLEDQMTSMTEEEAPLGTDRVDATVYAVTDLLLTGNWKDKVSTGQQRG